MTAATLEFVGVQIELRRHFGQLDRHLRRVAPGDLTQPLGYITQQSYFTRAFRHAFLAPSRWASNANGRNAGGPPRELETFARRL